MPGGTVNVGRGSAGRRERTISTRRSESPSAQRLRAGSQRRSGLQSVSALANIASSPQNEFPTLSRIGFHARNESAVFVCMDTLISNADDARLDETCARCCQDFARKKTHKIRSAGLEVDEAVSELVQHFLPQARSRTTTGEVERLIYGNAGLVLSRLLGNTSPMGPWRRSVKGPSKRPSKESSRGRQNEDTQLTGGRNRRSTIRCVSSRGLSDRADQTAGAVERVDARDAVTAAIDSLKKRIPRTGWIVEQFMLQEAGMAAGDWRRRAAEKYGITVRRAYQLKDEGVTLLRHYC